MASIFTAAFVIGAWGMLEDDRGMLGRGATRRFRPAV